MSVPTEENNWISVFNPCPIEILERAWHILETNRYCTLSTCSSDGIPWASPVFFCHQGLNLYWSSAIQSRHSQNLYRNNGRVAIAIYNSEVREGAGQGIYFSGSAAELPEDQVAEKMSLLFQKASGPPPDRTELDYLGDSPRRMYGFQPQEAWMTGDRLPIGKQLVDTKVQLSLDDLINCR
ncbi:MAG: pyridoxamine 5'-phosphate oxidase family protein [Leptolyngbyaceae cyanobacterium]